MARLPTGTVTFLFTDIEGSTRLLQQLGARYASLLADHHRLLRAAFQEQGGEERETHGDGLFFAFPSAKAAVLAVVAAQRAVLAHHWPDGTSVRIRMGLHTGEPLSEETGYVGLDVHRAARICAAGHGGQILISQTTRDLIEADLPGGVSLRDLGEHRLKDLTRPEHLFQVVATGHPADFPPLKSPSVLPNNLPIQLTTFIGREREMAEVKRLLSGARLLTVSGPGGAGKTRLALQVAADLLQDYSDGVWLVELGTLSDPTLVPDAVASVLSVHEQPGRALTSILADYLQPRHVLLVLDNCEHLVAACGDLSEVLLRVCPNLRILSTSREAMGVAGEVTYPVPPLSLPDVRQPIAIEHLAQSDAVRLFVERASMSRAAFALTEGNAATVVQVCHRLDGIPLALELAAARARVLSVEQIAQRLDDRFRLLTGGSRTALPRHRTLQAAIDWSYDLLSEPEQVLLRRLSVFAGGFTLEAAEAVCPGERVDTDDVLDLLTHLVDKSLILVVQGVNGQSRYRMLETVRHYGLDRLMASEEGPAVRSRHRDFFLVLAEDAEQFLRGPEAAKWLERLAMDHDNFRAALEWSSAEERQEAGLRLAGALWWFWYLRGFWSEGRRWLDGALSRSKGSSTSARAKVLLASGGLAWVESDHPRAVERFEESIALCRQLGDQRGVGYSLALLGHVAWSNNDYERGRLLVEESLGPLQESGHTWGTALALCFLGRFIACVPGDYRAAVALLEDSLALFRKLGDAFGIRLALGDLGLVVVYQGDYKRARALLEEALSSSRALREIGGIASAQEGLGMVAAYEGSYLTATTLFEESLALFRELGSQEPAAHILGDLGGVAWRQGDFDRATALLKQSLALNKGRGAKIAIPWRFERLAEVSLGREHPRRAARLFGAAEALREELGAPLPPCDRPDYDQSVAAVRAALNGEAFAAAWAEGRAMTLEQAVEYALRDES